MSKRIKVSELLNPKKAEKYQPELMHYFEQGGTWQDLLGYDQNTMAVQYKTAYEFYQSADFKKAAEAFSYLTMLNPYEYTYWMGFAIAKQSDRAFEEAIVAYTMAEAIVPENPIPHLHLAQCYWAIQQRDKTVEHLKKAIEIAGNEPQHQEVRLKAEAIYKNLPK